MANKKITELDAITTLASTDVVPVVDVSADTTNKITTTNLFRTLPDGTAAAPALAFSSDQANGVYLAGTDTVGISTGGTQRVTVDGSGNVTISGDLTVSGATTTVESTTVTIDDKNIELGSVASPSNTTADGGGITLKGATDKEIKWVNSTGYWTFNTGIEVGGHLQIDDSNEIRLGTSQDLKIYHDGSNSRIDNYVGSLILRNFADDQDVILSSDDGSGGTTTYIHCGGSNGKVQLYHLGSEKLNTKADGVNVTGEVQCDSLDVDGAADITGELNLHNNLSLQDNDKINFGGGNDLQIYHDGNNSFIKDAGTGELKIAGTTRIVNGANTETLALFVPDGQVELFHNNSKKFATKSDGIDVTGEVQCDSLDVDGAGDISGNLTVDSGTFHVDASNNRVGIGTSSPANTLHVDKDTGSTPTVYINNSGSSSGDGVALKVQASQRGTGVADASVFSVHNNASEIFTVRNDGNVGVGTSSPGASLDVESASDQTVLRLRNNGGNNTRLLFSNKAAGLGEIFYQGDFRFVDDENSDAERLRIDSSGNVGIGTTSPGAKLSIEEKTYVGAGFIRFLDNASSQTGTAMWRPATDTLAFNTNSTERLRIDSSGRAGVGLTPTSATLEVQGQNVYTSSANSLATATTKAAFRVKGANNSSDSLWMGVETSNAEPYIQGANGIGNNAKDILLNPFGGDVGIGTTAPNSLLDCAGGNITLTEDTNLIFKNSARNTNRGAIQFTSGGEFRVRYGSLLTEAMRIDSSGRLMLGTTTEGNVSADDLTIATSSHTGMTIRSGTSHQCGIYLSDGTSGDAEYRGYLLYDHSDDHLRIGTAAVERFRITSTGAWSIEGSNNYGTSGQVLTSNGNDAPTWQDASGGGAGGANAIDMNDSVKINFGASDDLQIYHTGTASLMDNLTGHLFIQNQSNDNDIIIRTDNGSGGVTEYIRCDGSTGDVKLYQYGNQKLQTFASGVDITGELQCDSLDVDGAAHFSGGDVDFIGANYNAVWDTSLNRLKFNDNANASFGSDADMNILHNGSNSHIQNATGGLYIDQNLNDGLLVLRSDNGSGGLSDYVKCQGSSGEVFLYHYGSQKFKTKSDGVDVTGEVQCDSLDVDGGGDFTGDVLFRGGANAVLIKANSDIRFESGNWTGESTKIQHHSNYLYIQGGSNGHIFRSSSGSDRIVIENSGHLRPAANNSHDLGTSSLRWRNVYTNDLNLSNEGSGNDVDGTWGNYTIQEGEDDLFLINRRNGKKYKFNLTEVS